MCPLRTLTLARIKLFDMVATKARECACYGALGPAAGRTTALKKFKVLALSSRGHYSYLLHSIKPRFSIKRVLSGTQGLIIVINNAQISQNRNAR